jgi:hypothetical protein
MGVLSSGVVRGDPRIGLFVGFSSIFLRGILII